MKIVRLFASNQSPASRRGRTSSSARALRAAPARVQYKLDLNAPGFADLGGTSVLDAGIERTVTDLNATETNKSYRVQITVP